MSKTSTTFSNVTIGEPSGDRVIGWTLKSGESLTIDFAVTPTFCQFADYEQPETDWFSWVEYGQRIWPSFCSWIVCANEARSDVMRQIKFPRQDDQRPNYFLNHGSLL